MSDPKCARMLVAAAQRGVLTLRSMTAGAPEESFGCHVQQAAEKVLKAWLALLGRVYLSRTTWSCCLISWPSGVRG